MIDEFRISSEIALTLISQDLNDCESPLIQMMAYLTQIYVVILHH